MGPARVIPLAAILCVCVTAEAFKPISWIQPKRRNNTVIHPEGNYTLVQPRVNDTLIQPRENDTLIQPRGINLNDAFHWFLPKEILGCGTYDLYPGETVTIQSQNYPRNYPKRYSCTWKFMSLDSDSTISILCNTFKLRSCKTSFVRITGGNFRKRYCGSKRRVKATSTTNKMQIFFKTKGGKTRKGFQCTVSASGAMTTPPNTTRTPSTTTASPTTTTSPSTTGSPTTTTSSTTAPPTTTTSPSTPGSPTTTTSSTTAPPTTTTSPSTTASPSTGCKCGHVNTVNRIVGGNPTDVHEYPWQVAMTSSWGSQPFCGGSIISNQWILTAAHCVQGNNGNPANSRIVIGDHIWNSNSDTTVKERRRIEKIIDHPNYNSQTQDNDMALIKLQDPIVFSSDNKIAPICLPPSGNLYENVDATITGWGTTSFGGSQPSELHEVTVPTMSNSQCQQTDYGSAAITSNMICAGLVAGGKDSCQGDSGGAMITAGDSANSFLIQIGVVSWGAGCADPNRPGVYARVNNYLAWISTTTVGSSTCPSA